MTDDNIYRHGVYTAAFEGRLDALQELLTGRAAADMKEIVEWKTDESTPLVAACCNGHFPVAAYLVESCHADIEQAGLYGKGAVTPLWCAATWGRIEIMDLLLGAGADVDRATESSPTALHAACRHGCLAVVQRLVELGADLKAVDHRGDTGLMRACHYKHVDVVNYLLERGADVNARNKKGVTTLHFAALTSDANIMSTLIQRGATVASVAQRGWRWNYMTRPYRSFELDDRNVSIDDETPLSIVTGQRNVEAVALLAANYSRRDRIRLWLLLGAEFISTNNFKEDLSGARRAWITALMHAESSETSESETLSDIQASLLGREPMGGPAREAVSDLSPGKKDQSSTSKELLGSDGGLDDPRYPALTPIAAYDFATEVRSVAEVEALTLDNARVQAMLMRERLLGTAHNSTLGHLQTLACQCGKLGDVRRCAMLFTHALDLRRSIQDTSVIVIPFQLAFHEVVQAQRLAAKTTFERWEPPLKVDFAAIAELFRAAVIKVEEDSAAGDLTAYSTSLQTITQYITFALHIADTLAQVVDPDALHRFRALLRRMLRIDLRDHEGRTLLHAACLYVDHENPYFSSFVCGMYGYDALCISNVVAVLIEEGADIDVLDNVNNTPAHVAAMRCAKEDEDMTEAGVTRPMIDANEVMELLYYHGAHMDGRNEAGHTPLELLKEVWAPGGCLVNYLSFTPLKCLAARSIVQSGLKYEGMVPGKLGAFIAMH